MATSLSATQHQLIALGGRLRQLRRDQGLSQAAFARQLGICAGTLRRMEQGRPGVSIGRWAAVLRLLDGAGAVDALLAAPGPRTPGRHQGHRRGMRLRSTWSLI